MNIKEQVNGLRDQIAQFMQLHKNPFDTSTFNPIAGQLEALDQLLARLTGRDDNETPSNTNSIDNSVGSNAVNNSDDVKVVQTLLNNNGASLTVDGDAGRMTVNAIRAFQQSKGLTVDGLITPNGETFSALNSGTGSSDGSGQPTDGSGETPTDGSGSSSGSNDSITGSVGEGGDNNADDVRTVQTLLNGKGANLTVDGQIGSNTINAIKSFQRSIGHNNPDGRIDVNGGTWNALVGSGGTVDGGTDGGNTGTGGNTPPVGSGEELPPALSATSRLSGSVGQGGQNNPQDVTTVSTILQRFYSNVQVVSESSSTLVDAIKRFQREYRGSRSPDGRVDVGGGTWNTMLGIGRIRGEVAGFAQRYGVEPAVILAIQAVESGGNGFLSDGRPRILFEGHIFWRELEAVGINPRSHVSGNGDILYSRWTREHYVGGAGEYSRLERAKRIHEVAALKSASWGEFQVMGFNHNLVGYSDVRSFVDAMQSPGSNQLSAVMEFCKSNNLLRHVSGSNKNWASFAEGYNGSGYRANQYDTKLANAYARFARIV